MIKKAELTATEQTDTGMNAEESINQLTMLAQLMLLAKTIDHWRILGKSPVRIITQTNRISFDWRPDSSPPKRGPTTAPVPDASRPTKPPAEQGKGKRPARRVKKRQLKAQAKAEAIAQARQADRLLGWRQVPIFHSHLSPLTLLESLAMLFRYPPDDIYLHETGSAPRTDLNIARLVGGEDGRWVPGLHVGVTSWASEVPQLVFVAAAYDTLQHPSSPTLKEF